MWGNGTSNKKHDNVYSTLQTIGFICKMFYHKNLFLA